MYRMVDCGTWDDPWFAELEPDAKLLFLYLVTNRRSTSCGAFEITERQMAFETGIPQKRVSEILAAFAPRVRWWTEHRVIWLSNFYKHQSSSDKFRINAQKMAADLPYEVRVAIYRRYPELQHPDDPLSIEEGAPSIGHAKPIHSLSAVKEEVKEEVLAEGEEEDTFAAADAAPSPPKPPSRVYAADDPYYQLAQRLASHVLTNNPKHKPVKEKQLQGWANDARLMTETDERELADSERLLDWCQADGFWRANILSMSKFREKWDTLYAQMSRPVPLRGDVNGNRPHAVNGQSSSDPASQMGGGGNDSYTSGRFGHIVQRAASR